MTFVDSVITIKGPKGTLTRTVNENHVQITIEGNTVTTAPVAGSEKAPALWGTYAAHINNMIAGVTEGFQKQLQIEGVGYRAEMKGNVLVLNVGYSHSVEMPLPEGIEVTVEKGVITIKGYDKEVLGQFAANVRKVRPPEPYKGKGIHYVGEYIIRKQGKKAV